MYKDLRKLAFSSKKVDSNESERAIVHYISTNSIDRGGDVVNQYGIITDEYDQSKKTVLFGHDFNMPIGRNMWNKPDEKGVLSKTVFSKTAFADDIYTMHKEDILGNWSIGFRIAEDEGDEKAATYDTKTGIMYINKWKLHEYSSVSVAMNAECVDIAKGMVKSEQGRRMLDGAELELKVFAMVDLYEQKIKDIEAEILRLSAFDKDLFKQEILLDLKQIKSDITIEVSKEIVVNNKLAYEKKLAIDRAIKEAIKTIKY